MESALLAVDNEITSSMDKGRMMALLHYMSAAFKTPGYLDVSSLGTFCDIRDNVGMNM